ncbi:muscarinic acetylcholine receptor gar-3-like [Actinia tenebrosa]|uniref:Muscarinic acetylcholine receptor gar-3-like n=1 Tax=Actinia tenebrosa TaxID=6105 RepID=A0A6P8H507_ACTTE|nr:muscarinic acetylcholine receptor gar-3-like [Actinia tenebrosa]XP_031550537.1 muscarinic acetylcholine receptor gar-3-like [Actinia tenebrosa]
MGSLTNVSNLSNHKSTGLHNEDPLGRAVALVAIETIFALAITTASLLGNALVIYVVRKDSRLRTITNVFIESLAWTDVCMAFLHMPFWVGSIITGRWVAGQTFCPWAAAMQFTFGICSILTMGLIAVNRFFKVVKSNSYAKYFKSRRSAVFYCLLVWMAAALLATPPLYGWGVMRYHDKFALCTLIWDKQHLSYVLTIILGVINGTTVVIFYCYYKIYKTVKSSSTNVAAHLQNNASHATDIKLLKSTFAVVCFFLATWMPVSLVVVYETVGGRPPRFVFASVIFLMFTSSCGNPIIYGILNPQFRRAFLSVFKCRLSFATDEGSTSNIFAQSRATAQTSTLHCEKPPNALAPTSVG